MSFSNSHVPSRRNLLVGAGAAVATTAFGGAAFGGAAVAQGGRYGRLDGDRFPVPAVNLSRIGRAFLRTEVAYDGSEPPGTIVVDPAQHFLYAVKDGGRAVRYGVGVGRQGFGWSGEAEIHDKQEWPDWYPPKDMLQRQPELMHTMSRLKSGIGMPGGPRNPLGARAMYLWQDDKDTLYRIHGTVEPWSIGHNASSGCIRMIDQDVIELYGDTPVGTRVVVLGADDGGDLDDAQWGIPSDIVRDRRRLDEQGLF
jgi:lipoprotein-anchoring transpeptidase ErfK/SrfK